MGLYPFGGGLTGAESRQQMYVGDKVWVNAADPYPNSKTENWQRVQITERRGAELVVLFGDGRVRTYLAHALSWQPRPLS